MRSYANDRRFTAKRFHSSTCLSFLKRLILVLNLLIILFQRKIQYYEKWYSLNSAERTSWRMFESLPIGYTWLVLPKTNASLIWLPILGKPVDYKVIIENSLKVVLLLVILANLLLVITKQNQSFARSPFCFYSSSNRGISFRAFLWSGLKHLIASSPKRFFVTVKIRYFRRPHGWIRRSTAISGLR